MSTIFAYHDDQRVSLDAYFDGETLLFGYTTRVRVDELLRDYPRSKVLWLDENTYATACGVNALLEKLELAERPVVLTDEQRRRRRRFHRRLRGGAVWATRLAGLAWLVFAAWVFCREALK